MFSLESPHRGDSNDYTQYTIFNLKNENHPILSKICMQDGVRNSRGIRAISVRAIEVLLYFLSLSYKRKQNRMGTCYSNDHIAPDYTLVDIICNIVELPLDC